MGKTDKTQPKLQLELWKTLRPRDEGAARPEAGQDEVHESWRQFISAKVKLQELNLEYAMLYLAHLWMLVDGKAKIFSDLKQLQQILKQLAAAGTHQCSPRSEEGEPAASRVLEELDRYP
ncbi:hypothetical protein NDU88_000137 [Pleurodeles waltl]|uniref:Uncharacterized protein n=1 Tax=Pleurodeles waltl TaxID=8319 RepID=A0AAV7VWI3_PLEWA|nr:hypothetical protein NDU88_000137 [Pleurodeles waltl]